jgi:hypothetical protein
LVMFIINFLTVKLLKIMKYLVMFIINFLTVKLLQKILKMLVAMFKFGLHLVDY